MPMLLALNFGGLTTYTPTPLLGDRFGYDIQV